MTPQSDNSESGSAAPALSTNELESELKAVLSRVRDQSGEQGPISPAMLPAIHAGAAVVGALLNDGQLELARSVLQPIAKEVDRMIARGS